MIDLIFDGKTETWKEPYATIDVATEKDYELLVERIERQIAKKPKIFHGSVLTLYPCPICGEKVKSCNYCPNCGQKIDWSGIE